MRSINPFGLRMPDALKKRMKAEAKNNNRSLNAEIVHRLMQSVGMKIRAFKEGTV